MDPSFGITDTSVYKKKGSALPDPQQGLVQMETGRHFIKLNHCTRHRSRPCFNIAERKSGFLRTIPDSQAAQPSLGGLAPGQIWDLRALLAERRM